MSEKIREIRGVLEQQEQEWNWEFSYAPLPGNQRIKVMAVSKASPSRAKMIYLGAALLDHLPPTRIAQNLLTLLPTIPEVRTPSAPQIPAVADAKSHYEQLRKIYSTKVEELRHSSVSQLSRAEKSLTNIFNHWKKSTAA